MSSRRMSRRSESRTAAHSSSSHTATVTSASTTTMSARRSRRGAAAAANEDEHDTAMEDADGEQLQLQLEEGEGEEEGEEEDAEDEQEEEDQEEEEEEEEDAQEDAAAEEEGEGEAEAGAEEEGEEEHKQHTRTDSDMAASAAFVATPALGRRSNRFSMDFGGGGGGGEGFAEDTPTRLSRLDEKSELQGLNKRLEFYILNRRERDASADGWVRELEALKNKHAADLEHQKKLFENQLQLVRKNRDELSANLSRIEGENAHQSNAIKELQARLALEHKARGALEARVDALQKELLSAQNSLHSGSLQLSNLQHEYAALKSSHDDLEASLDASRKTQESAQSKANKLAQQYGDLSDEYDTLQTRHAVDVKKYESEIHTLCQENHRSVDGIRADTESRLNAIFAERQGQHELDKAEALAVMKSSFDEKLLGYRTRLEELGHELEQERSDHKAAARALDRENKNVVALLGELRAAQSAQAAAEKALQAERACPELSRALAEKQDTIRRLKANFKRKDMEFDELMDVKIMLDLEIKTYRTLLDQEDIRVGAIQMERAARAREVNTTSTTTTTSSQSQSQSQQSSSKSTRSTKSTRKSRAAAEAEAYAETPDEPAAADNDEQEQMQTGEDEAEEQQTEGGEGEDSPAAAGEEGETEAAPSRKRRRTTTGGASSRRRKSSRGKSVQPDVEAEAEEGETGAEGEGEPSSGSSSGSKNAALLFSRVDASGEYVGMSNNSGKAASLGGWVLRAPRHGQSFSFPDVLLESGASFYVTSGEEVTRARSGVDHVGQWGRPIPWLDEGDLAELVSPSGQVVASVAVAPRIGSGHGRALGDGEDPHQPEVVAGGAAAAANSGTGQANCVIM